MFRLRAFSIILPYLGTFWHTAHQEAWQDLKTRGRRGLFWTLCFFVFFCSVLSLAVVLTFSEASTLSSTTACRPDGAFSLDSYNYKYWDASGFFQITLGFGTLTFSQAKAIDVVWDVVIGRGGQALLALISWHVFAKYVTTSMDTAPITFGTFRTVFLHNEASLVSIPRLIRDFSRRHGLHSRVAMVFMIATLTFILIFPTFASAMTGYSANVQSYVQDKEGNYLPFNTFRYVFYIIHDGSRIDLKDNFEVTVLPEYFDEALLGSGRWLDRCLRSNMREADRHNCELLDQTTWYIDQYWNTSSQATQSSSFGQINLPPPSLNITTFFLPREYLDRYGPSRLVDELGPTRSMTWIAANQTYNQTYIEKQGTCQAQKTYKWGFSFIQLNLMIIFLLLWMVGIYSMYLNSHVAMNQRGSDEVVGEYKAVFELASAMQAQLYCKPGKEQPFDTTILTEKQIRRIIKDLDGGSISLTSPLLLDSGSNFSSDKRPPIGFRAWLRKEKWWLIAMVLAFAGVLFGVIFTQFVGFAFLLPIEAPFVIYVGQSGKSRGALSFWPFWSLCLRGFIPVSFMILNAGGIE